MKNVYICSPLKGDKVTSRKILKMQSVMQNTHLSAVRLLSCRIFMRKSLMMTIPKIDKQAYELPFH